ncbi:hypothetical protein K5M36_10755 [Chromobacterium vaccinii]|nr:hypothetical protein [Chromobacterium vaccinii]
MKNKTFLEKLTGTAPQLAATIVATAATTTGFTPIAAALLTPLMSTLAYSRHMKRIEDSIEEINKELSVLEEDLFNISDAQYKFISETVVVALQASEEGKLDYLKLAIKNGVSDAEMNTNEANILSRIIRDISLEEISFLCTCENFQPFFFVRRESGQSESQYKERLASLAVHSNRRNFFYHSTSAEHIITGLISTGLIFGESGFDGTTYYFSPIIYKLASLLGLDEKDNGTDKPYETNP